MRRLIDLLLADLAHVPTAETEGLPPERLPLRGATGIWASAPERGGQAAVEPLFDLAEEPAPDTAPDPDADPPAPAEPPVEADGPSQPEGPAPPAAPAADDPAAISWSRLLEERPDVLRSFYEALHGPNNDRHSDAWKNRVGGETPEAYAKYWYEHYGRYEGYNQGPTTAADNVSPEQILRDRPDVLRAFYEEFYGPNNDRNSDAWMKRVGGDTPEAYAKYWYEKYGKWEGYAQSDKAAAENIDVERLLSERPDVYRAFYEEFYGPNNDRKSSAWIDRVGGDTVQDYAKYWYVTFGQRQGYSQREPGEETPPTVDPPVHDPSEDPWNHLALFPDWKPPYEGWEPPPDIWHPPPPEPGLFG